MNYIFLAMYSILFTNCYAIESTGIIEPPPLSSLLIENPSSATTTVEINSGVYLQTGDIFNTFFMEIEDRFPDYRRLVKDIAELEISKQLLIEEGMDMFVYEIDMNHLELSRVNLFEMMIEPEIRKVDKIQLLTSKIPGLNATQAALILEDLGVGEQEAEK